jgi:hypothetical protein
MQFVTNEQFNKFYDQLDKLKSKNMIDIQEIFSVMEEQLGYPVSGPDLTYNQKKKMTDAIFSNEHILIQLRESALESDEDLIENKETFMRVIRAAQNEL